jgi:hypothetical protein
MLAGNLNEETSLGQRQNVIVPLKGSATLSKVLLIDFSIWRKGRVGKRL